VDLGLLIRKLERLYPLTAEEKDALSAAFVADASYPRDQDVFREDECPSACRLLLDGMVCRYVRLPDGKRQILSFHVPGDIFDAQSFMMGKMDHSVATLMPCKVAVMPHGKLKGITENYPRIARAIWKDTLVDSAVFRQWIVNVGRRTAYERVAHLICEIYTRFDVVGLAESGSIAWPLTQAQIGDATSLSTMHVNRTLQQLRLEYLIDVKRSYLKVLNWQGLKMAGDFDPKYLHFTPASGDVL
jgi:CRP-like cAMP-binding protein